MTTPPTPVALTMAEIEELERLLKKSTPGQWKLWGNNVEADTGGDSDHAKATFIAKTASLRTFDADLICTMQRSLPALLAVAREHARLESQLHFLYNQGCCVKLKDGRVATLRGAVGIDQTALAFGWKPEGGSDEKP